MRSGVAGSSAGGSDRGEADLGLSQGMLGAHPQPPWGSLVRDLEIPQGMLQDWFWGLPEGMLGAWPWPQGML